ncbi:MAG: aminotransferase class V-fold PLP-dependent enzyme [Rhodospirillales bacterium]|nr:aminotransferase class V-fold PLP-dependent enzyme [Rhodospirillales bacterium]
MSGRRSDRTSLDAAFVRRQFPALDNGWAFFENAGGSYVPQTVIDRTVAYMTETQVQPGASFGPSAEAEARMAAGQRLIAELINAEPDEIVVGPSTTTNTYFLGQAIRPWLKPGDEVIVTNIDHEANQGAWRRLAEVGATIKEWRINLDTFDLEIEALEKLLTDRTKLVCFTHCSNITGSLNDVARITKIAHAAGALVCVDGVAFAPHRAIDVKALDVDFYFFSPYKVFGPHLGVMYGKREHLLRAQGQNHFFFQKTDIPRKIPAGYPNHELSAALVGVGDYFDALHRRHFVAPENRFQKRAKRVFGLITDYEGAIGTKFMDFLRAEPKIRVIGRPTGDAKKRATTFSFTVKGRASAEIPPLLERGKIGLRNGDFYAVRLMDALGLERSDGVIRASMVHYTSNDDVERLIRGLEKAI